MVIDKIVVEFSYNRRLVFCKCLGFDMIADIQEETTDGWLVKNPIVVHFQPPTPQSKGGMLFAPLSPYAETDQSIFVLKTHVVAMFALKDKGLIDAYIEMTCGIAMTSGIAVTDKMPAENKAPGSTVKRLLRPV